MFIDILVHALGDAGACVKDWRKHFSLQTGDVFHVHWPELIADIAHRPGQYYRGRWIAKQLFATIRRIRRRGGIVAWTAHNLRPHRPELRSSPFLKDLMERFTGEVDVVLSLTEAAIEQVRAVYPALASTRFEVTRHPHYRGVLHSGGYAPAVRRQFGISPNQRVISFIGTLRRNKQADRLADAFAALPDDNYFLIIAGDAAPNLADTIRARLRGKRNAFLEFRHLSQAEVLRLYSVTDVLVFPGHDYLNSGTIYTALSLDTPVLAEVSASNRELQSLVGEEWLQLFDGELGSPILGGALSRVADRGAGARCDLSSFEPGACAEAHLRAYAAQPRRRS